MDMFGLGILATIICTMPIIDIIENFIYTWKFLDLWSMPDMYV